MTLLQSLWPIRILKTKCQQGNSSDLTLNFSQYRRFMPVIVIALLAIAVMAIAAVSHWRTGEGSQQGGALQSADLLLEDREDGSIAVFTVDHQQVDIVPPASNGFLRVILAGMVRERRREGLASRDLPFHLSRWQGGRLTLDDIATHHQVDLDAFGPTNAAAFGHLLDMSQRVRANP